MRSDKQQLSGKGGDRKTFKGDSGKAGQSVCMGPYETALCPSRPWRTAGFHDAAPMKRFQYALFKSGQECMVQFSKVLVFEQNKRRLGA